MSRPQTRLDEDAVPRRPDRPSEASPLAPGELGGAAGMVMRLQQGHGNAYTSRLLQRDATTAVPSVGKPGMKLSPREAVHQLQLKILSTDGLFDTMQGKLREFEGDMKTELGWYAGDKKASSRKKEGVDAALDAASSAAKSKAKETVTAGVKLLAGMLPKVGGPAATAAGMLGEVLWKQFDSIADYDPVIIEPAMKKPHQHYIEAADKARKEMSRRLMEQLTESEDEMAAGPLEDVKAAIKLVDDAIKLVDSRFYLDLVQGYRDIAPAKTVELETPHAQWTGEKRGLWGGGTWVTPIKSGTIYVEFKAKGSHPEDIQIVKTVLPELPRDVMERFDEEGSALMLGHLVETDELVMEGEVMGSNGWDVRIVKEATTSKLKLAQSPSYTWQYCQAVAGATGSHGSQDESRAYAGAVNVYAKIISTPLDKAKLGT